MPMGRPPVPTEIKDRRGTLRPDRLPAQQGSVELPGTTEPPKPPRGLTPASRRVWCQIWTTAAPWLTPDLDSPLVEQACRVYDEIAVHRKAVAKHGSLVEEVHASASGKVLGVKYVANPACKLLRDAEKSWSHLLVLLAIPPTERARLGLTQVRAQSKLEKLAADRAKATQPEPAGEQASHSADPAS